MGVMIERHAEVLILKYGREKYEDGIHCPIFRFWDNYEELIVNGTNS